MNSLIERFLTYVKIDTQSDDNNSDTTPSTKKQWNLINLLKKELDEMKINSSVSEFGYLYAFIPKNIKSNKSVGFLAHVDTAPDASGENVKPRIIKNYDGKTIKLNEKWSMDKKEFGDLNKVVGDDIIVTDGNTLLGADDKAGVSVIIELCDFLSKNPKTPHPDIYICFTPDEEIGMGTSHIDLKKFKPDFAYTIDGDDVSCIEYETFNAASASVEIYGKSVHPGSAKNKMVNSMLIGMEFHSLLPQKEQPQFTEKYEGFNHLTNFNGNVEKTKLSYIIRNHDKIKFNKQKETFKKVAEKLNKKYKYKIINLEIKDQYYNMGDIIKNKKEVVNIAEKAAKLIGIKPYSKPVRGGTDGSKLTYMGIACPNIGAGGFNFHGRYEFCSINQMQKSLELVKQIVSLLGKDEKKVK